MLNTLLRRHTLRFSPRIRLTRIRPDKTVCYGHPADGTLIARQLAHGVPFLLTSLRTHSTRQHRATPSFSSSLRELYRTCARYASNLRETFTKGIGKPIDITFLGHTSLT